MIYLNAASTTQPTKEVVDDIKFYLEQNWSNPSDISQDAVNVKRDILLARNQIAESIGASEDEIFFTSGGSEANNWAIKGILDSYPEIDTIITTEIEHPSVYNTCKYMKTKKYKVYYAPLDKYGCVDIKELENLIINKKIKKPLVSIMFANNEIGSINNIGKISEIVHGIGGIFHTDAVQAFMHTYIDVEKLGIDLMSVSAHKVNCPKGIGFLYKQKDLKITPLIHGGKQEFGMRGGTENVPYICAFGNQVERLSDDLDIYLERSQEVWRYLVEVIHDKCAEYREDYCSVKLNGSWLNRIFNNVSVTFDGINADQLITLLDLKGFNISAGSACCAGEPTPSRVLKAIGMSDKQAFNTVRISFDYNMTKEMVDEFADILAECICTLKILG